jgi:hypothetical protein
MREIKIQPMLDFEKGIQKVSSDDKTKQIINDYK